MATQQEVIKSFMASLDTTTLLGKQAISAAIQDCSNFKDFDDLKEKLIKDSESYIAADSENGWKNFLFDKCGIILGNDDTGAIIGSDAGNGKVKTSESIISEDGEAYYPSGTSFTKRGLTFIIPEKSSLSTIRQKVIQGLYSWWADSVLDLLEKSYGYSFSNNNITVKFFYNSTTSWSAKSTFMITV